MQEKTFEDIDEKAIEIILNFNGNEKFEKSAANELFSLKSKIKKAILLLPKDQKEILESRYFQNLSNSNIALKTRKPEEEVSKLLLIGIKSIKDYIKGTSIPNQTNAVPLVLKVIKNKQPESLKALPVSERKIPLKAWIINIVILISFSLLIYFFVQKYFLNDLPTLNQHKHFVKHKITHLKNSNNLKISGSTSLLGLSKKWEDAFLRENPKYRIILIPSDSNRGIDSLVKGEIDIANSSRPVTFLDQEKANKNGLELVENRVALDALIVIVNKKNPVNEISVDDLGKIFKREIKNWQELNSFNKVIFPIAREKGSGTNDYILSSILIDNDFSNAVSRKNSNDEIINLISQEEGGISCINSNNYPWGNDKIKYLMIKIYDNSTSVSPFQVKKLNERAIRYGDYPLAHYLYLITLSDAPKEVTDFVNWVLSYKGQKIVKQLGLISLKETK